MTNAIRNATLKRKFLLTCLLRGMTFVFTDHIMNGRVSTHMPLARHDIRKEGKWANSEVSTHMPLARHDKQKDDARAAYISFYSHASCEAWPFLLRLRSLFLRFYSHASCEAWLRVENVRWAWWDVSTHMPLARHDFMFFPFLIQLVVSTHMPLARHDQRRRQRFSRKVVSTHMPLARHDTDDYGVIEDVVSFYSHASCEAWQTIAGQVQSRFTFLLTCLLRGMTFLLEAEN